MPVKTHLMSSCFPTGSESIASELRENVDEMFLSYWWTNDSVEKWFCGICHENIPCLIFVHEFQVILKLMLQNYIYLISEG